MNTSSPIDWKERLCISHPSKAIELWNRASIAYECNNSVPLEAVQEQILLWLGERLEEWENSIAILLAYLGLSSEYALKKMQIFQIERAEKAISIVSQHVFLTKAQEFSLVKSKAILLILECFSEGKELRFDAGVFPKIDSSTEGIRGAFDAIHAFFTSPMLKAAQAKELSLFFEDFFQQFANNAPILELLRQESTLKMKCEAIFVLIGEHYWRQEDSSLQIAFLQKGSNTLKSAKLAYESCFVAFQQNSTSVLEECLVQFSPSKNFDEFMHFLHQVSQLDAGFVQQLIVRFKEIVEPAAVSQLELFQLQLWLKRKDFQSIRIACTNCKETQLESIFMQLWIHAEVQNSYSEFKMNLLAMAVEMLKRISKNCTQFLPITDLYKRILMQFSCSEKNSAFLAGQIDDFPSEDDALNLIQFRLFFAMGDSMRAWRCFEALGKGANSDLLLEILLIIGEKEEFWEPVFEALFLHDHVLSSNQFERLAKLTMNFAGNSRLKAIPLGIQKALSDSKPLVQAMKVISKEYAFKTLWNVAVDSLNCQNYTSAFVLFEQCQTLAESVALKESAQICQFMSGVCQLKAKNDNADLILALQNLYMRLEHSNDELFIQYKLQFMLATGKVEMFSKALESEKLQLSLDQILDLIEHCKSLQIIVQLLDSYTGECSDTQVIDQICFIVQECISEAISSTPAKAYAFLHEFSQRTPPIFTQNLLEWISVTAYNYALFLKDSHKKEKAKEWSELAYSLSKHCPNVRLQSRLQAFYISTVLDAVSK